VNEQGGNFDFLHAGMNFSDMFYSGSLPKIGAMYAAFELLRAMNENDEITNAASPAAAFARARALFDPVIDASSALISAAAPQVTNEMRLPTYGSIFSAVPRIGGGFAFALRGSFTTDMRDMIVKSDNGAAGKCIMALGYSWLNGCLERAGFFFPPAKAGIWLAGTYIGAWPPVRVPCVNDTPTAQGITCFDTANLYAHLLQGTLTGSNANCSSMLALLSEAAGFDSAFLDWIRRGLPPKSYQVNQTKIGIGTRVGRKNVLSEATVLTHVPTGRRFIAVLQNIEDPGVLDVPATLVDTAINSFVAMP